MALQKDTDHKGFTANYWRIQSFGVLIDARSINATFVLYKDKDTRDNSVTSFVETHVCVWDDPAVVATIMAASNPREAMYTQAKLDFLTGALDI